MTNLEYAREIARQWNTRGAESGHVGVVLRFTVPASILEKYPARTVGAGRHEELWVPAGDLEAFNAALIGPIEVVEIWWPPVAE